VAWRDFTPRSLDGDRVCQRKEGGSQAPLAPGGGGFPPGYWQYKGIAMLFKADLGHVYWPLNLRKDPAGHY
jgi:hypothetical protein